MLELFLSVLVLGLASAASPEILAVSLSLLASKNHPKEHAAALLAGCAVVAIPIALSASELGGGVLGFGGGRYDGKLLDLVLGVIMLALGLYCFIAKPHEKLRHGNTKRLGRVFLLGFFFMVTNVDGIILNFTAIREIAESDAGFLSELALLLVAEMLFLSPALFPLCLYVLYPNDAERMLEPLNCQVRKYGHILVGVIMFGMGAYFLARSGILPF